MTSAIAVRVGRALAPRRPPERERAADGEHRDERDALVERLPERVAVAGEHDRDHGGEGHDGHRPQRLGGA